MERTFFSVSRSSRNLATGSSYSSMRTTTSLRSLFAATAFRKSSKFFSVVSSLSNGTPCSTARPFTSERRLLVNFSYVEPAAEDIVKDTTGNGLSHSHGKLSMARPLKSSRRPSNIAFKVESMSDLPNRRGREIKSC